MKTFFFRRKLMRHRHALGPWPRGVPRAARRRVARLRLVKAAQQCRVSSRRSSIDRDHLLAGKAGDIMWPTRFWPRARQPAAAERLHADHGTNHVAVDVDIPVPKPGSDARRGRVNARVDAE